MDEMCMVVCGKWVCGSDGKWEFVVDKGKMARMIPVDDGVSILELERRVVAEFKVGGQYGVALSYWPPDSLDLATGIKTPPVLLTSDGALKYFFSHMKVRGSLNLFATYERVGVDVTQDDGSMGFGFETPMCEKTRGGVGELCMVGWGGVWLRDMVCVGDWWVGDVWSRWNWSRLEGLRCM